MPYCYNKFSSLAFMKKGRETVIDKWKIHTLSFCLPKNKNKTPIVILGGAFQNFFSFKKDVQCLIENHPVILMDLPSQGNNPQIASELGFADFADLIKKWIDEYNIPKINLVGLSYGSAIAYYFGSKYPKNINRMVMAGTTTRVRESYRKLLKDSIQLLKDGDMKTFAEGAVMNLINYNRREETGIHERVVKGLYHNMLKLDASQKQRYIDNTLRLLDIDGLCNPPECKTLIMTGEFDNFTSPYENYIMAKKIPNSILALVKKGDHLGNIERRDVVDHAFCEFFSGADKLDHVEGLLLPTDKQMETRDKRLDPRYPVPAKYRDIYLRDKNQKKICAKLVDINTNGCKFDLDIEDLRSLDRSRYLEVILVNKSDIEITCHVLEDEKSCRGIFRRGNLTEASKLETLLSEL